MGASGSAVLFAPETVSVFNILKAFIPAALCSWKWLELEHVL